MMISRHIKAIIRAWQCERKSPPKPNYTCYEYDFQPGYLEIVERPPVPWARLTALSLTLLILMGVAWSALGLLDIHANATGRLLVSNHSKVIQSLEAGEILRIRVRDGQRVEAGEVLIDLNPIGVEAEWKEHQVQLKHRQLERAKLKALLTDNPLEHYEMPTNISPEQAELTKEHLRSVWDEISANLASIDSEMRINLAKQQAKISDINSLERLSGNIDIRLKARTALAKQQLIPKMELLEQEKERLEIEQALLQQHDHLAVLKAEYQGLVQRRESFLAKTQREYYDKLNLVRAEINVMEQQLIKIGEKQRLQRLRAPVNGVVQQIAVHTEGGVVQPAQKLMVIVPDDALLEADVMVLNKDIGFVHAGQTVEIKIDSFPFTRYGTISGRVEHVSKDAVKDEKLGLVFPTRIQLSRSTIAVEDKNVPLQAGMSATAEIRTGRRRIIEYLLSPLQQYQSEALRER
ncbi:HlyD family type I secretion periplasmic adaptor subunit [Vibrio mediterranei]